MKRVEKILTLRVSTSDFAARTLADSIRNPEKGIHTKVMVRGLNAFSDYFVIRVVYDNTPENQNLINSLSANQPLQPREETR